jgi:hypothetical protein
VPPAFAEVGFAERVIPKSAFATTVTVAGVAELFVEVGSPVVELTVAAGAVIIVPTATVPGTVTTNVNVAVEVLVKVEPSVQETVPVAPTAGVVQVQPVAAVPEAKVELVGMVVVQVGAAAVDGPLLVTVMV